MASTNDDDIVGSIQKALETAYPNFDEEAYLAFGAGTSAKFRH
jgi:hypothetical protein